MNRCFLFATVALVLVVAVTSPADAQVSTSEVRGSIKDTTGAPIPGVTIRLVSVGQGITRETLTDNAGSFLISALAIGEYEVFADLSGFSPFHKTGLRLSVAEVLRLDIVLSIAGVAAEVQVIAMTERLVNTTSATLGQVVGAERIAGLPLNGRNWAQLATLSPGVSQFTTYNAGTALYEAGGIRLTVGGARDAANRFLLDGVNLNDLNNRTPAGLSGQTLGVDAIQEFRVLTSSYGAEFGGGSGGIVTAVTKSGTSKLHGTLSEFLRDDAIQARNYFDSAVEPAFRRNQFGGTLGGPTGISQTFFFGAYEGFRETLDTPQVAVVPDALARAGVLPDGPVVINPRVLPFLASPLFALPNGRNFGNGTAEYRFSNRQIINDDYALARVDAQLSANHGLMGRYQMIRSNSENPITGSPAMILDQKVANHYGALQWQSILSDRWVGTFRANVTRTDHAALNAARFDVDPAIQMVPGQTGNVPPQMDLPSGSNGSSRTAPISFAQTLVAGRADFVYAKGAHVVKFGANVEHYNYDFFTQQRLSGQFIFTSLRSFLEGTPQTGFVYGGPLVGEPDVSNLYFSNVFFESYAQVDWNLRKNVTVNLGLRYEPTTVATEKNSHAMLIEPFDIRDFSDKVVPTVGTETMTAQKTLGNWAPRLGLVWDLRGDGKTALRAGYGTYFDPILGWPYTHYISAPTLRTSFFLSNPQFPNAIDSLRAATQPPPFLAVVEPNLRSPRQYRWSADVQHELPWGSVLGVAYVGARGKYLSYSATWNSPIPDVLPDGELFVPAGRPRRNPAFGNIRGTANDARSWYQSLQTSLSHSTAAFTSHFSYTLSEATDYKSQESSSGGATGEGAELQNPFNLDRNKGPAAFDATHALTASLTGRLPSISQAPAAFKKLINDWSLAGILTLRSGVPFTPGINGDWPRLGPTSSGNAVPNWAPGRGPKDAVLGEPGRYFDPNAFILPLQGTIGNVGRNSLRGPWLATVDLAATKRVKVAASQIEFRVEVFNAFNRANFDIPNRIVFGGRNQTEAPLPTAGVITRTVTPSRTWQFGVKVVF